MKSNFKILVERVKNECEPHKSGYLSVMYQYQFIKDRPNANLPDKTLTHSETLRAFEKGIHLYLSRKKSPIRGKNQTAIS